MFENHYKNPYSVMQTDKTRVGSEQKKIRIMGMSDYSFI